MFLSMKYVLMGVLFDRVARCKGDLNDSINGRGGHEKSGMVCLSACHLLAKTISQTRKQFLSRRTKEIGSPVRSSSRHYPTSKDRGDFEIDNGPLFVP